ncbi:TetR/AcrR family transcriptional regulator [Luteipulveratus mongoliensis]|uniref:TetR family transcriptional regulator n=1 Tax=Luteipulveratus mongoliensis TaxID=571913 RepID=A0A0K1JDT4_9MICO|nr:TetR/AcrR family transcriptional regulator [Luteipulveratus mongoliensis]AKU14745.1 TetR family transcriptional regulator [Luteipulveratus mongoliensis]
MAATTSSGRPSEARERLLATTTGLFYAQGIHSVGVERIVAEAKVTRATFYRHFASKEDLVVAYLQGIHEHVRANYEHSVASGKPAPDVIRDIGQQIVEEIRTPGFRGCAFLNAAAEYPDPDHSVHQVILSHRRWFLDLITDLFAQNRDVRPVGLALHFVMLRDGVMAAGYLGDPVEAADTFSRGVDGMLRYNLLEIPPAKS